MDIVNDFLGFLSSIVEGYEILLKNLFDDRLIIYGIPWWQWVLGGSFLVVLGNILLSKIIDK